MLAVIKSNEQYQQVLRRVDALIDLDPSRDSDEGRELEVLAVLMRDYERRLLPLNAPSPLTAIRLRMEQAELAPKDLVPFFGSRGRVSEVLSGKRPLSLAMIRALHAGLGIALESLVQEERERDDQANSVEWDRFPVKEMARRGWLNLRQTSSRKRLSYAVVREVLTEFFGSTERLSLAMGALQKSDQVRTARTADRYALTAWSAYVARRSERVEVQSRFRTTDWSPEVLKELRGLSRFDVGPRLAVQFLEDRGIIVDVVPHLPRTRLDGAAMLREDGVPVIALTLRHDRLDNFWFTLFHELMHVLRHLTGQSRGELGARLFLDDLDLVTDVSALETEADSAAREALLPTELWERSAARYAVAATTVSALAREAGVADAIVAGRVRHEHQNFRLLSQMVGAGKVRALFPEVAWDHLNE